MSVDTSGQKRRWLKMLTVKKCLLGNIMEVDANPVQDLQNPDIQVDRIQAETQLHVWSCFMSYL